MPPSLPSNITMWIGAAALVLAFQFFGGIFTEWGKRWVRGKNDPREQRRTTDVSKNLMHDFIESQKTTAGENATVLNEIKHLASSVEKLAQGMVQRGEMAFEQHGKIIEEIHKLDVPRRPERRRVGGDL